MRPFGRASLPRHNNAYAGGKAGSKNHEIESRSFGMVFRDEYSPSPCPITNSRILKTEHFCLLVAGLVFLSAWHLG